MRGVLIRFARGGWELLGLLRHPRCAVPASVGMTLYWAFDLASFYAALRVVGLHLDLRLALIAYGTGYALTRRSLPLGGAGVTELLMTVALVWVREPMMVSLAAVVVYRVFNFLLPAVPALLVHAQVESLITAPPTAATEAPVPSGS